MEIFTIWLLSAFLAAAVLSRYKLAGTGFLLGAFLGPFGVLFALVLRSSKNKKEELQRHEEQMNAMAGLASRRESRDERECPHCAERILVKAKICKHCGKDVLPA